MFYNRACTWTKQSNSQSIYAQLEKLHIDGGKRNASRKEQAYNKRFNYFKWVDRLRKQKVHSN